MLLNRNHRKAGFTLVEMAIVLGVAGLLFGGLWRLLSIGNVQMRDQATANQHSQLISGVSAYLQTSDGQNFMKPYGAGALMSLTLPAVGSPTGSAGCAASIPSHQGLCTALPPGISTGSKNPYGQSYQIVVMKDNSGAGIFPSFYSFMILTSGGDIIPDTSGGRISAMIGGDGGFLYTNNVCGGPTTGDFACGSYGAWTVQLSTTYFAAAGVAGHVASRTYYSPAQSITDYWLARKFVTGDVAATPVYNTMTTPLFLGGQAFYLGSNSGLLTGGGTINMQAGTVNVQSGTIALGSAGKITGTASATGGGLISLVGTMNGTGTNLLTINGGCSKVSTSGWLTVSAACSPIAQLLGDVNVVGLLQAYSLYSGTFVYTPSDERLKKDIQVLTNPLNDIMKLKAVSFAYKADGKKSMGVIAQELEKVYPLLVDNAPTGFKSVAYEGLIAPLLGSVQELKNENDALRVQLKEQAARQEKMERAIEALQKK